MEDKGKRMEPDADKQGMQEGRRAFLRKSAYAAYTTPLIMSMLVEKANAAKSWNSGRGEITGTATPKPPDGGTVGPNPGIGVDNKPNP